MTAVSDVAPRWHDQAIDTVGFWDIIETAPASAGDGKPFHEALADSLVTRVEQEILDYQEKFDEAHRALYRWDVWQPHISSAAVAQMTASQISGPG